MSSSPTTDIREQLRQAIHHFEHVLPGQAAIKDFVHHNTLHGFEHLPFPEALAAAHKVTGAYGYLPEDQYREFFKQGRITREDLSAVLDEDAALAADEVVFSVEGQPFRRRDILLTTLVHPLKPVSGSQLTWRIEELNALRAFQEDVPEASRKRLLEAAGKDGIKTEAEAIEDLWAACLHAFGLDHFLLHPEELVDLTPEQAEQMLSEVAGKEEQSRPGQLVMDRLINDEADQLLDAIFEDPGQELTLLGLLKKVTGTDLLEELRPLLIRHLASFLDQGFAAWNLPKRDIGFYAAWRACAADDLAWVFEDLPDWADSIDALPEDPLDAVIIELKWLGLEEDKWESYLERLALALPGWSGMVLWRHLRAGYEGLQQVNVDMMDYLAVRLVLERLFAQRLCRELWMIEASFDIIRWYFRHHRPEFLVRYLLFNTHLPEYLITLTQRLVSCSDLCRNDERQWLHMVHMIWTWRQSPGAERPDTHSVNRSAWRLFRLAQHLGVCGKAIRELDVETAEKIMACIDELDQERAGFVYLQAYERHYREQIFNALANNQGRGRWPTRNVRAEAQIVFCMDDREEGIRRHLEEHNPAIETLGAAGFFGVPINWRGLDDEKVTPLCPVVVTPAHEVREEPKSGQESRQHRHKKRRGKRLWLKDLFFQETRRNVLRSSFLIFLAAPATLVVLTAKMLAPLQMGRFSARLRRGFDMDVSTSVAVNASDPSAPATPEQPRQGFTDAEQAERVSGFLRTIGLQQGFAPLVVMMGHGSISQNNPHLAAYDCGACSGRHGGPNARAFAAMANRPQVRQRLAQMGIEIPEDTWFLGTEHNTCDETITWYDLDAMPEALKPNLKKLQSDLGVAVHGSAHERSRRFASAPQNPAPEQALKHIIERSMDISQARPELGHATNAAAFIGRRSMSQGAFFDRRVFLISYDPTQDPEGSVLEAILLAAGPVGAGINLEYYFSTVNNEQYGCGSKVTHNVTGLFGVMEGASSDLRTGLPRQMIEIHEAMRLQIVVEASTEVLTTIYQRQPVLQQLIGNGWLLLSAKDPNSDAIHVFKPDKGFVPWQGEVTALSKVSHSTEWYNGHRGPLTPVLIDKEATHA